MLNLRSSAIFPVVITLLYLFTSCNKPEQDKNRATDEHKQELLKADTEPSADTNSKNTAGANADSVKVQKKRRNDSLKTLTEKEVKILAYYFHPTARCVTCRNIEAYSYEAVREWEKKNKKKIAWKELNIEDSVNEHYVDEFNLQFSSLIIVKYVGGKKDKWKNLEDTWKLVNDKSSFIKYVMYELNQFVKNN